MSNVSEFFTKFLPDTDLYKAQNLIAMTGLQSKLKIKDYLKVRKVTIRICKK